MNARDRRLATWLVVLSDRIPGWIDQILDTGLTPREWNDLADLLAGTAELCRERGMVVINISDSGRR